MTYRATIDDVRLAFKRFDCACHKWGLIPGGCHLVLSEGSKTYGNAYRVNLTGDRVEEAVPDPNGKPTHYPNGSGHWNPPIGADFLGMTKAEAYNELHSRARVLEDLARLRPECVAAWWGTVTP